MQIEEIEKSAMQVIEEQGTHTAQIMFETKKGIVMMMLMFRNDEEKELIRKKAREFIQEEKVQRYFTIMECWMRNMDKDKAKTQPYIPPSRALDRIEALIINEYKKGHQPGMIVRPFKRKRVRNKEKIIWEKKTEITEGETTSLWNFFLEEEGPKEKMDKQRKEQTEAFLKTKAKEYKEKYWSKFNKAKTDEERTEIIHEMVAEMQEEKSKIDKLILEDIEDADDDTAEDLPLL